MEGRRVSRRRPRRNPLYVIFMALLALTLVLLIAVIALGAKLRSARSDLADAEKTIEQLRSGNAQQLPSELDDSVQGDDASGGGEDDSVQTGSQTDDTQTGTAQQTSVSSDKIDWLDLTGHSEVKVKPTSVYDKYYVYYTTNGVNLRAGPGTSYDKVKLVDLGTEVKAAAKQDGWTFVAVGDKFGWINSDYLSTTRPEVKQTETTSTNSSSGSKDTTSSGTSSSTTSGGTTTSESSGSSGSDEMPDWLKNN